MGIKSGIKAVIRLPSLFRYASCLDWVLMFIGTVMAIAHGTALPLAMLVFGDLTNAFINQFSSAQLVLTEFYFNPLDFIGSPRFAIIDPKILESGFINFTNLTGGIVNCSEDYVLIPPVLNFEDALQLGVTRRAMCLDNEQFIIQVERHILAFVLIAVGVFIVGFFQITSFQLACERQVHEMRLCFYRAILRQDVGWFNTNPSGELTSRLSDDIELIRDGIGIKVSILIQWVTTFIAGFIIGFTQEWRLTLFLLGVTPFIAASVAVFSMVTAYFTAKEQSEYASSNSVAEQVLSSIRTVIAFGGEHKESERYNDHLKKANRTGTKKGVALGTNLGIIYFLIFGCYATAFWFSAYLLSLQLIQAGEVLTVFFAVLIGAFSIGQAAPNLDKLVTAAGASVAIYDVIDRTPPIDSSSSKGVTPEHLDSTVEFRDVTFAYPSDPTLEVVNGFSLHIEPGKTVALVGPSGSGKSTVLQLLQRFYDVVNGEVLIGGNNVRDLNLTWLRSHIGVVSQEPVLFDATIAENIRFGKLDATYEEIVQAAKSANAHKFISELPNGYDTSVGRQGAQLSGGQKQRIAIARALVRDPKILLLDDATSALDSESERVVQAALDRARQGRTTVVISHRLSTFQTADTVAVMENGCVVEMGTHEELMDLKGNYYDLVFAQYDTVLPNELSEDAADGDAVHHGSSLSHHTDDLTPTRMSGGGVILYTSPTSGDHHIPEVDVATLKVEHATDKERELPDVSWLRIIRLILKDRLLVLLILLGVLGAAVQGATFPVFAIFFGQVIRVFTFPFDEVIGLTHLWACLFLVLAAVSGVANFTEAVCLTLSGERLMYTLRSLTFKAMLRQEMAWFEDKRNSTGALTVRLASDASRAKGLTGPQLGSIVETVISMIVAVAISAWASWVLTLVVLGFLAVMILSGLLNLLAASLHVSGSKEAAGKIAVDSIDNIRTVAALSIEDTFYAMYKKVARKSQSRILFTFLFYGITFGLTQCVIFFGYVVTFRFGAYQLTLPVEHIAYARFERIYIVFIALIFGSLALGQAGSFETGFAKAKRSARKLFAIMDRHPAIDNYSEDGLKPVTATGEVEVRGVHFSYPTRPNVNVLMGLNLSVHPGKTLALVGASGCGKTTVTSLLQRFYDPKSGSLTLDGIDISDLNVPWLRSQIGIVFQEPVLFDGTIMENIQYGANFRKVLEEEVIKAAVAANIHSFIISLPQGYDTNVGDKGAHLSAGQKQQIAIARALIRSPKVLLLDEATSALDTEQERIVQEALDNACSGRTSIVIAHRLSTIYNADCIVVIQGGKVSETGTHSELLARKGIYFRLHSYQMGRRKEFERNQ